MLTRIELHNFMSHAETVIEPAAGLTVLVGPNNVGKSAIVAALKILCRNENSTYVLRHGQRDCAVIVETDDGHRIEWRRRTSPSYLIDGQKFDRLKQGGLPEELHKALRLPAVDSGNEDDFDVHFGTQKAPIFLLNGSAATAARFFASSSDAIRLVEIQRRHKEKYAERQREKNRLEAESKLLHAELETLEPVVDLDARLRAVELDYEHLGQQADWLRRASAAAKELAELTELRSRQAARAAVLARLPSPPTLENPSPLQKLMDGIVAAQRAAETARHRVVALANLSSPPVLESTGELASRLTAIEAGRQAQQRATAVATTLAAVPIPPALDDPLPLARTLQRLARESQAVQQGIDRVARLAALTTPPAVDDVVALRLLIDRRIFVERGLSQSAARYEAMSPLTPPPIPADMPGLQHFVNRLDAAARKVEAEQREVQRSTEELLAAEQELRAVAAQSTCRLCGSPLDPDRVLARAAGGLTGTSVGGHDHA